MGLVQKYGVVPASVMPETDPSTDSQAMNRLLTTLLLQTARRIRDGEPVDDHAVLGRVHRLLCICMGGPPPDDAFAWTYKVKRDEGSDELPTVVTETTTALDLYRRCDVDLSDFVVLAHVPRRSSAQQKSKGDTSLGKAYTVEYLTTVHPSPTLFYNVSMAEVMNAAYCCLKAGIPVHFACEFDFMRLAADGLLHHDLVHYERAIGEPLDARVDRVLAKSVKVDHAMLLTGYHEEGDEVTRWQVENSHGDVFTEGYLSMSSGWFRNHVFCVAVPRAFATSDLSTFPVETLPPWDVIGTVLTMRPPPPSRATDQGT